MRDVVREPALATYSQRSWRPRDAKKPCASERTGGKLLLLKRRESTSSAVILLFWFVKLKGLGEPLVFVEVHQLVHLSLLSSPHANGRSRITVPIHVYKFATA